MEILKSLFRSIVRLVAINIALILFFASAPLLYVTVPFWVILTHKSVADMATIYMLTGPFACGFWMTVICHWHTVRKAQREGRLANWRDSEGGMFCTVGKSIGVHGDGLVRVGTGGIRFLRCGRKPAPQHYGSVGVLRNGTVRGVCACLVGAVAPLDARQET